MAHEESEDVKISHKSPRVPLRTPSGGLISATTCHDNILDVCEKQASKAQVYSLLKVVLILEWLHCSR
jgi:hypothetical protein